MTDRLNEIRDHWNERGYVLQKDIRYLLDEVERLRQALKDSGCMNCEWVMEPDFPNDNMKETLVKKCQRCTVLDNLAALNPTGEQNND